MCIECSSVRLKIPCSSVQRLRRRFFRCFLLLRSTRTFRVGIETETRVSRVKVACKSRAESFDRIECARLMPAVTFIGTCLVSTQISCHADRSRSASLAFVSLPIDASRRSWRVKRHKAGQSRRIDGTIRQQRDVTRIRRCSFRARTKSDDEPLT